jgi:hypothetical protein
MNALSRLSAGALRGAWSLTRQLLIPLLLFGGALLALQAVLEAMGASANVVQFLRPAMLVGYVVVALRGAKPGAPPPTETE